MATPDCPVEMGGSSTPDDIDAFGVVLTEVGSQSVRTFLPRVRPTVALVAYQRHSAIRRLSVSRAFDGIVDAGRRA